MNATQTAQIRVLRHQLKGRGHNGYSSFEAQLPRQGEARPEAFPKGRLVEITGDHRDARHTLATTAVLLAQFEGEPTAWVQSENGGLYPPDLHDSGVDLEGLVIVSVPEYHGNIGLLKAAELLLRSGSLGTLVIELKPQLFSAQVPSARILRLAQKYQSRVIILSESTPAKQKLGQCGLSSLVSLRMQAKRRRIKTLSQLSYFSVEPHFLKNKVGFLPPQEQLFRSPWGIS